MVTHHRRRPSRQDVADAAGVSPATVSLVLNGRGDQVRLAKRTQARVREAAERLRYIPHSGARSAAGQRFLTVGVVARRPRTSLHLPIFADFTMVAIDEAARHGHSVKFLPPVSVADSYDVPAMLRDAHVDAVLVQNLGWLARDLADWSVPVVYVGLGYHADTEPLERVGVVTVDDRPAPRQAARHLLARGHTQVAVTLFPGVAGRPGYAPRVAAFIDELRNGSPDVIVHEQQTRDWSGDAGYKAMQALVASGTEVSAVYAGNDWMAGGVLRVAHQAGLRVPEDLEVVGFGDFQMSPFLEPPLTTVRWPLGNVVRYAMDMLMAQLDGRDGGYEHVRLEAELITRESSPGIPKAPDDQPRAAGADPEPEQSK